MTHPPQQPGPYGQDPYGRQPGQFGQPGPQPPGYGGHPGGPGAPPPRRRSPWVIVAVAVGALLVLAGAGTGIYFLTKDEGQPGTAAAGSTDTTAPGPETPPRSTPPNPGGTAGETQPPATGGGGGGGGGSAEIADVAGKYAKAVTDKDATTAKSLTCDKEPGILYDSANKIEIAGEPQMMTEDLASVQVRISVSGMAEPLDGYPLTLERKDGAWCVI
jgi:hypothetical protein